MVYSIPRTPPRHGRWLDRLCLDHGGVCGAFVYSLTHSGNRPVQLSPVIGTLPANRSHLQEVRASLHARTSTLLSLMPRRVHIPAPACRALLCPCLVMATRGHQGLLSSRLARRGARDRDAQQPCCDASRSVWVFVLTGDTIEAVLPCWTL